MAYWLIKSEPDVWSFEDQMNKGGPEEWHGVRNYAARNHMRAMKIGEKAFFYHSNQGKEIVGIAKVAALSHPDSTTDDPRWDCVDFIGDKPFKRPVTLEKIKVHPELQEMVLVNNSRLSVQPVTDREWKIICELGGVSA
ncbi:MAG: EVE domain-containing protein [Hyphomicrobiaceae bacterium]|nr:EVE domain-containing protein [Hyphomicrobiaceae bacterium]MCC0024985.1 EVE domain-containing protein [Hyphomicrobiaceae bacterium]